MLKQSCLFLIVLFTSVELCAQFTPIHFRHLTSAEGLTQGVINYIYKDSKGFVWLTGLDGINRFDGSRCLANDQIAPGLDNPGATGSVIEDANGDIWIGYSEGVIRFSYRINRFDMFRLPVPSFPEFNGKRPLFYSPIFWDRDNNLLISCFEEILLLYNTKTKKYKFYKQPLDSANSITLYTEPGNASLTNGLKWVMHSKDSILMYTLRRLESGKEQWSRKAFPWKENILSKGWMPDGNTLFFHSNGTVCKYNLTTGRVNRSPEVEVRSDFISLVPDAAGRLWISGTGNGVVVLDTASMQLLTHLTYNNKSSAGISNNNAYVYIDREQMLWVVAWGRGVDYTSLTEDRFSSFVTEDDAKAFGFSNFIRGIAETPGGDVLCSTQSGIIVLNSNLQFKQFLPGSHPNVQYPDIYMHNGKVYYVSDAAMAPGLYRFDAATGQTKKFLVAEYGKKDAINAYQLSKMNDHTLLVASMIGLWKFDTEKEVVESLPGITPGYYASEVVVYSYQDKQQQVYKCVKNQGFTVYREIKEMYTGVFLFDKKMTVKHIVPINDSLLWMGTTDGLYLFNSFRLNMVQHFTTANGLPNNVVYAIMPDEKNNLWLSTNQGLSYFNVAQNTFTNFTQGDGLQANEFNSHAVIKAKDGRIIFGGVNGLTVVNTRVLTSGSQIPVLQITALKTDSICNPYPYNAPGAQLKLQPGANYFELEWTAIQFTNPALCKIKYRLKGVDNTWQYAANPGTARYTRLPPGTYVLEAMSSNARGQFTGAVKTLEISVAAYWWQTGFAKFMFVALVLAGVLMGIRLYVRAKINKQKEELEKQMAVQKERERIIADLHDDVGATLSSMHIYGDLAGSVWHSQPETSKEMVGRITRQAKDLMGRMGDIIWSMKPPGEENHSFTARLKNYSNELLAAKNIECIFQMDDNIDRQIRHPEARKNIMLIAKEVMNNIAKYSEATTVTVSLHRQDEAILFSIADNGKGYDTVTTKPGNGIHNIQQRCRQLQGTCSIHACPGQGVQTVCTFPLAIISYSV